MLGTLGAVLAERLPGGSGTYPGPLSVIDPGRAFLFSPTPAAGATGGRADRPGRQPPAAVPDIPGSTLFLPRSVSFASATRGWVVGENLAVRAVLLATIDGGRSRHPQLPS